MAKYLVTFAAITFYVCNILTSPTPNKGNTDLPIKKQELQYFDSNGKEMNLDQNQEISQKLKKFYQVERDLEDKNTPLNSFESLMSLARTKFDEIFGLSGSKENKSETFNFYREDITFTLYTRQYVKGINLTKNYNFKEFDVEKQTKILFHGYRQNSTSDTVITIKDNYLNVSDIIVIIIDYRSVSVKFYPVAVYSLSSVADYCTEFIAYLFNSIGMKPAKTHFIGHSLGGQLAGFVAKRLIVEWMKRVERVTGLDPAGPLFSPDHLSRRDAEFVDIIHTDRDRFGLNFAAGHVDFYPNGGVHPQPNCTNSTAVVAAHSCSHKMSWVMYSQTILNNDLYIANCTGDTEFPMGSATPSYARGNCTLDTGVYQSNRKGFSVFNIFDFLTFTPVKIFDWIWNALS